MSHSSEIIPLHSGLEPVAGYRLDRPRGQGGFAEVWEAEGPAGQRVALKFISTARMSRERSTVKEIRSIQTIRSLRNQGLIRIHTVVSIPGWIVVAMELCDGSLMDLLQAYRHECQTAMPPEILFPYLSQVAKTLDFLNTRQHCIDNKRVGIQHADVKPNNILLIGEKAVLADFGMATVLSTPQAPNYCAGTLMYAAPEVFQGSITEQTDQYAFAVTYHVLRTGKSPFKEEPEAFGTGRKSPIPDLSRLTPAEQAPIMRALSVAPVDRWPNCGTLLHELECALKSRRHADAVPMCTPAHLGWGKILNNQSS